NVTFQEAGEKFGVAYDRNGNAGPTIWVDGRVVGGWAQRKSGEVVCELFQDVGKQASDSVKTRAAELQLWLGEIRVTPRFRSPHDKTLTT
ncbi:MAG: DNA glycosylase AlkZ-like family protein, partial [Acidimicrobiia bacterium]